MLLKDGVSFRLLTAVDPVNIQVIASDPDLNNLPVLSISNPPSKHVIANDAWIMNEKGDTISKIDYKALLKGSKFEKVNGEWVEHSSDNSSIKPIATAEKTVDVIAGTPIFKPEKMEEQHRGAEFGAFIGMDFYPFYCIAPSLVREYGVYASDEIIEQLRKTRLVSYVFLSLLKENAEKYNPEVQTINVTDTAKPWFLNSKEAISAMEAVLPPESLEACEKQLIDDPDVAFVIVHTPEIVSNLLSSVLVVVATDNKYSCTAYYPGKTMTPKDFLPADLKAYVGIGDYAIFGVYRDKGAVILTKLSLDRASEGDYYKAALARKRFHEAHPQFMGTLSTAGIDVPGIVEALKGPGFSVKTLGLADAEEIEQPSSNTDQMRQALFDKLDNVPEGIADYLDKDSLWLFKTFVVEHVKGLLRADVRVTTAIVNESWRSAVTISTAQHKLELPPVIVHVCEGKVHPSCSPVIWSVHQDKGEFQFIQVEEN